MSPRHIARPKCRHARRGIVTAGGPGAHAATNVCDRPPCIADAIRWAETITGLSARHIPDTPGLFPKGSQR